MVRAEAVSVQVEMDSQPPDSLSKYLVCGLHIACLGLLGHELLCLVLLGTLCSRRCEADCELPRSDLGVLYLTIQTYPRVFMLTVALPACEDFVGPDSVVSHVTGGNWKVNDSHWEDQAKQTYQIGVRNWENTIENFAKSFSGNKNQEQEALQQWDAWAFFPARSWNLVAMTNGVSCGEYITAMQSRFFGSLGLTELEWRFWRSLLSCNKVSAGLD